MSRALEYRSHIIRICGTTARRYKNNEHSSTSRTCIGTCFCSCDCWDFYILLRMFNLICLLIRRKILKGSQIKVYILVGHPFCYLRRIRCFIFRLWALWPIFCPTRPLFWHLILTTLQIPSPHLSMIEKMTQTWYHRLVGNNPDVQYWVI